MNNQQHLLQALNLGREAILAAMPVSHCTLVDHMYVDDHVCVSACTLIITPSPPGAMQPHLGTRLARMQLGCSPTWGQRRTSAAPP